MNKAELIKTLEELDMPDDTNVYIYGDFAGGQLDYSPIRNIFVRNEPPHIVGIMDSDGTVVEGMVKFSGILISCDDY
jgi:hypothetical protein